MRAHIRTAINLWLLPFLIGGSIAIGYKITHKALFRLENKNKHSQNFLKKEIVLIANCKQCEQNYFPKKMKNNQII